MCLQVFRTFAGTRAQRGRGRRCSACRRSCSGELRSPRPVELIAQLRRIVDNRVSLGGWSPPNVFLERPRDLLVEGFCPVLVVVLFGLFPGLVVELDLACTKTKAWMSFRHYQGPGGFI